MNRLIFTILLILSFSVSYTQTNKKDTIDFKTQLKSIDLVNILAPDSISSEAPMDIHKFKRPEILGFIDTNYTRFQIHFITIKKDKDNPFQYKVIGKTNVKNNICDFQGTITVKKSKLYTSQEFPEFKEGFILCDVIFFEDSNQVGSGIIKGKLTTNFYLDKKGQLKYNDLMLVADGFSNNEQVGTWTSYKTNKSKICNWGDFRIPNSNDFDMGAGEFSPADKYLQNGWQSYRDSFGQQFKPKNEWWKE